MVKFNRLFTLYVLCACFPQKGVSLQSADQGALNKIAASQDVVKPVAPIKEKAQKERKAFREAEAKDGARISITAKSLEDSVFQISGENFKPYESLTFVSNSCGEVLHAPIQADSKGNLPAMGFLPAVIGKAGGICHIDILRKKDSIHVQVPWGTEIFKNN